MNKPPAFQFYPDKWLAGTRHLRPRAYRAYMDLLCWMWLHDPDMCGIKNDQVAIQLATGLSGKGYKSVFLDQIMNPVMPLLRTEGNRLISKGLRKEATKYRARRARGEAAADARWGCPEHSVSTPQASAKQCLPSPSPTLVTDVVPDGTRTNGKWDALPQAIKDRIQQLAFECWGTGSYPLEDWLTFYPPSWLVPALERTVKRGKKQPAYTQGILESWREKGGMEQDDRGEYDFEYTPIV